MNEKKQMSTPINSILLDEFKNKCDLQDVKFNTVIEALMMAYVDGYIQLINTRDGIRVDTKQLNKGGK